MVALFHHRRDLPIIISLNSASEVWRALAAAYGVLSNAQHTQLHIELHNLSKDIKSISEYLYQAKAILDLLTLVGQPISTSEFIPLGFFQILLLLIQIYGTLTQVQLIMLLQI